MWRFPLYILCFMLVFILLLLLLLWKCKLNKPTGELYTALGETAGDTAWKTAETKRTKRQLQLCSWTAARSATDSAAALLHWTFELVSLWRFIAKATPPKDTSDVTYLAGYIIFDTLPRLFAVSLRRHLAKRLRDCIVSSRFPTPNSLGAADIQRTMYTYIYIYVYLFVYIYI